MQKFEKGFFVGAATAAHQVEGNNIHSDYWAQEQLPHTSFTEPSGIAWTFPKKTTVPARRAFSPGL